MVLKYWTNDFARCAYLRPDRPNQVLIQYSGDDTKARQFPHRNSTNSARNFTRTQPSVIASVEEAGASASGPVSAQRLYQSMVVSGSASATPATSIPRNTRQVKNTLVNQRNKTRPTRDATWARLRLRSYPAHYYIPFRYTTSPGHDWTISLDSLTQYTFGQAYAATVIWYHIQHGRLLPICAIVPRHWFRISDILWC